MDIKIDEIKKLLITKKQFSEIIDECITHNDSPITGLQFIIEGSPPYKTHTIGTQQKKSSETFDITLDDGRKSKCRVRIWKQDFSSLKLKDYSELLEKLFDAFWKSDLRTTSAGMMDYKREPKIIEIANSTFNHLTNVGTNFSIISYDLDEFSTINDVDHKEGNRVIKELGAVIESIAFESSILLHNGGDEFLIFLPNGGAEESIMLIHEIQKSMNMHDFNIEKNKLNMSSGIVVNNIDSPASFEQMVDMADNAVISLAKLHKNTARFCMKPENDSKYHDNMDLVACIVKSTITNRNPSSNVWLNCISNIIVKSLESHKSIKKIHQDVDEFIKWIHPDVKPYSVFSQINDHNVDTKPEFSYVDCGIAIVHGILHHSFKKLDKSHTKIKIKYNRKFRNTSVFLDSKEIWKIGNDSKYTKEIDFGDSWVSSHDNSIKEISTSRSLLISIGNNEDIPRSLFQDIIVVDDRPSKSGGLPDFWEAAISRIIESMEGNPNIGKVYVFGKRKYATKTIDKLEQLKSGQMMESLVYKMGKPMNTIKEISSRLVANNNTFLVETREQLVKDLIEFLKPKYDWKKTPIHNIQALPKPLDRILEMEKYRLNNNDGCRTDTILDAFPIVLEILRKSKDHVIKDQAGRDNRELIDFKVHLKNPLQNMIPAFYMEEKKSFEDYFKREFLDKKGLFGSRIIGSPQYEAVMKHLVGIFNNQASRFASRRAIIILPNQIGKDKDLVPLGLISIRCIPRFIGKYIELHYSFTWRTVEAFVGFPYSIFGSVKFSDYLTNEIKNRVSPELARMIKLGEVSYLANSLHMFVDQFGQNIAKRIVDDASS